MSVTKIVSTYKVAVEDGRFTKREAEAVIRAAGLKVDAREIAALAAIASADGFDIGSLELQHLYGLQSAVDTEIKGAGHWAIHRFVQDHKAALPGLKKPEVDKIMRVLGFGPAQQGELGQWGADAGGFKKLKDGTELLALVQIAGDRRDSDVVEAGNLTMTAAFPPLPPISEEKIEALGGELRLRRFRAPSGYADFRVMKRDDLRRVTADVERALVARKPDRAQQPASSSSAFAKLRRPGGDFRFEPDRIAKELQRRGYDVDEERGRDGEIFASRPGGEHGSGPRHTAVRVFPDGVVRVEAHFDTANGRSEVVKAFGYPGKIVVNERQTVQIDGWLGGVSLDKLLGSLWEHLRRAQPR